jgi:hypothetical protein
MRPSLLACLPACLPAFLSSQLARPFILEWTVPPPSSLSLSLSLSHSLSLSLYIYVIACTAVVWLLATAAAVDYKSCSQRLIFLGIAAFDQTFPEFILRCIFHYRRFSSVLNAFGCI